MPPEAPGSHGTARDPGLARVLRLVGWVAAANVVAIGLASMPMAGGTSAMRAALAWCGIG